MKNWKISAHLGLGFAILLLLQLDLVKSSQAEIDKGMPEHVPIRRLPSARWDNPPP